MTIKHFIAITLFSGVMAAAYAIPAKRVTRTLRLNDGSTVTATLRGDEHVHFWQTDDGRCFVESPEDDLYQETEPELLYRDWTARMEQRNNARAKRSVKRKTGWGAESNPISGQKKGLVILVNFQNKEMYYGQALFDRFFNEIGFSDYRMAGSVRDYFLDQSYGLFDLTFDVAGPVTVSKDLEYYGENNKSGDDKHAAEMVAEACMLVDETVDFSRYDWDGDGEVDQVFVVYAGYPESEGAPKYTIWPHEYKLSEAIYEYDDGPGAIRLDGMTIDTYACSSELMGNSGTNLQGIGVACHEFSHCMYLPDTYDTNGNTSTMDAWDVMDSGCYNGNSKCPASYTSYERMYCGWLTPMPLEDGGHISQMKPITSESEAYIIYNKAYPKEYYLLENHQKESWDAYAQAHGMLILHVDYDSYAWKDNTVNNIKDHQRMTIIPADNKLTMLTLSADTWPGTTKNTALTDTSKPAATLYNENTDGTKFMHFPIDLITENDGLISFRYNGGIGMPKNLQATDIDANSFTARWDEVKDVAMYEVMLTATDTTTNVIVPSGGNTEASYDQRHQIGGVHEKMYSIESNSCSFTDLTQKYAYSFKVRALNGIDESLWTEEVNVTLKGQNAVEQVYQDNAKPVVSDLQGRKITGGNLSKGIYIVNGRKVIMR